MLRSLLAFTAVAGLLTIVPGPDVALVVRTSLARGRSHGVAAGAGICTGLLVWAVASALGVTALVTASDVAYRALRVAGGAYLVWLGIAALRSRGSADAPSVGPAHHARSFRRGLLNNLLNPKIGVFYLTVLPSFLVDGVSVLPMTLLLTGVHIA